MGHSEVETEQTGASSAETPALVQAHAVFPQMTALP